MSEMVNDDVRNGMKLLIQTLLPKLITTVNGLGGRVKELEAKVAALETPKPKRTRAKKEPAAAPKTAYDVSDSDRAKVHELYRANVGAELQRLDVEVDKDNQLYVNDSLVLPTAVDRIKEYMANNPAAIIQDVCNATGYPAVVVCYIAVVFGLWDVEE